MLQYLLPSFSESRQRSSSISTFFVHQNTLTNALTIDFGIWDMRTMVGSYPPQSSRSTSWCVFLTLYWTWCTLECSTWPHGVSIKHSGEPVWLSSMSMGIDISYSIPNDRLIVILLPSLFGDTTADGLDLSCWRREPCCPQSAWLYDHSQPASVRLLTPGFNSDSGVST